MTIKNEIFAEGNSCTTGNFPVISKTEQIRSHDRAGDGPGKEEFTNRSPHHNVQLPKQAVRVIEKIKAYVEQNPLYEKKAADFAEELNVSRRLLLKWFKAAEGLAIKQYSEAKRLEVARQMLEEGEKSVKEIAILCKFKSPAYFSRLFKKKYGATPSKWKQKFS